MKLLSLLFALTLVFSATAVLVNPGQVSNLAPESFRAQGNASSGSHPLLHTQVILKIMGQASERISGQLPWSAPTAWHCPRAYRIPCCLMGLAACCFLELQVPHRYRWQVNNPHLFHDHNSLVHPPQTTSWTHATQSLPLSPAQLVLIIQSHRRDWMPLLTPPAFSYQLLPLSVQANGLAFGLRESQALSPPVTQSCNPYLCAILSLQLLAWR